MSGPPDLPASVDPTSSPRAVPARDPDFPPVPPDSDNGGNFEGNGCSEFGGPGCRVRGDLDRAVDDALSELFENDAVSNRDLEASSSSLGPCVLPAGSSLHESSGTANAGAPSADMSSHVNKFFLSEGKLSDIRMPWETPIMAAIFGSDDDFARLSQQLSPLPPVPIRPETVDASLSSVTQPQIASQSACLIQHVRDFRIQDKRQELSMLAVKKLALV